jgi:hypothetical protein
MIMQLFDLDFTSLLSSRRKQKKAAPIIGYDWESFPLRADTVGLLYQQHLENEQPGTFTEWKDLIRHFNAKKTIQNRIHTLGPK